MLLTDLCLLTFRGWLFRPKMIFQVEILAPTAGATTSNRLERFVLA